MKDDRYKPQRDFLYNLNNCNAQMTLALRIAWKVYSPSVLNSESIKIIDEKYFTVNGKYFSFDEKLFIK